MPNAFKDIEIESDRLQLKPLKPRHAALLYDGFCEPSLFNYVFWEIPKSAKDLERKFETMCRGGSKDGSQLWLNWMVLTKDDEEPVGLFESTVEKEKAYLAYYIFKPHQRCGLAKEGVKALIEALPKHYPIKLFVLEMDTRNRASFRLAESLGFSWKKTNHNVQTLDGLQSHEFYYELSIK